MTTVVVFEAESRKVIAAIPVKENEAAIVMNGVDFQIFNETEPVFTETPCGPVLATDKFILNPKEDHTL